MLSWHKTLQTPSPVRIFFCAYEVAQSLHENSMSGANTRSVLARFGDNNQEKGEDFVKTFYVQKLVWLMEGSLSARVLDDVYKGLIMLRKANWDKTLQKSLKLSDCRKSIQKQIRPSCRKNLSNSFCVCLVSWKQRNLEIRANIPKSCRRPVVSLLYATKLAFTASNLCWACALASPVTFLTGDHVMQIGFGQISLSASSTRDLGTRLWKIPQ